ncbi:MAG: endonuclease/exonuclease/phosphatase family protein, partial [Planctomycetota bacterium]
MTRSKGSALFVVVTLLVVLGRAGCIPEEIPVSIQDYYPPKNETTAHPDISSAPEYSSTPVATHTPSTIIVGSFNIQIFGTAKASRPEVMSYLVDIARRFDVLAIQELKNQDQTVIRQFMNEINSDGSQFGCIVGPRQGYTNNKEQYAVIFDTTKLAITTPHYISTNPGNRMHRPPLVTSFQCLQAPPGRGFSFTLLNIHTDPDVVLDEFGALQRIMPTVFPNHPGEDDFILLGDFNETESQIRRFRWLPNQLALVRNHWATKVRSRRSIDNIVIDGVRTAEFQNQSGVLDFAAQFGLSESEALRISDHFPVWAVFSTVEAQNRLVDQNGQPI